jgi:hypothetical protein
MFAFLIPCHVVRHRAEAHSGALRLLPSRDRRNEARTMLAEIYGWFTAGFNTVDLKDAKSMLDQLNA